MRVGRKIFDLLAKSKERQRIHLDRAQLILRGRGFRVPNAFPEHVGTGRGRESLS